jgi:hypothetical protein
LSACHFHFEEHGVITQNYRLSQTVSYSKTGVDLARVDETYLRYQCFPGDAIFTTGNCDFSAKWDWVPVIDFAVFLRYIASELGETKNAESEFDFTESEATIHFTRNGQHGENLVVVCGLPG